MPDAAWRGVARQLVAQGALDVAVENHGELVPTDAAGPILKGAAQVMLREEVAQERAPRRYRAGPAPDATGEPDFDALRDWRRSVSQAQGVPAYVVADDRTLAGIVARQPSTLEDLRDVPGMGRSRIERYGEDILRVLRTRDGTGDVDNAPA